MPRQKGINIRRLQNLSSKVGAGQTAEQANLDASSNEPIDSGNKDTLHHKEPAAYAHIPLSNTPESPDKLAENMNDLALEAQPEDDIVLEDPPNNDDEDPLDAWNPSSLAEPEGDEALEIHHSDTEVLEDDIDEHSAYIQSWRSSTHSGTVYGWDFELDRRDGYDLYQRIFDSGSGVWLGGMGSATSLQVDSRVPKEGDLPTNVYGTWNESVMEDEDLSAAIQDWLRDKGKYVQARDIIDFFGVARVEQYSRLIDRAPSLQRRSQFADGHERDDVKHHQEHVYIPEWTRLERRMRSWDADGKEVAPQLEEGERPVVVWFHDESTFYAHDRRTT
ncbi:DDE family endonuclease [Ceratobasidium sp. AG-Ba]|nr:DDE family endonuclease [Ceratobasidium sp. AG-Ba]